MRSIIASGIVLLSLISFWQESDPSMDPPLAVSWLLRGTGLAALGGLVWALRALPSFDLFGVRIPFMLAVGVLPYPLTFLCTDFISEFYGQERANHVVFVGLGLNAWVVFILWLGGILPPVPDIGPNGLPGPDAYDFAFYRVRQLTMGAVVASMFAYLAAQLCDVYLFHFWKRLTRGRHLWLRNNGSTLVSQLVDSFAVITITHFWAGGIPIDPADPLWPQLFVFIASGYVFKLTVALLDTLPFYLGVAWLSRYLEIDPTEEHEGFDGTLT